jgi:hypothetical protein
LPFPLVLTGTGARTEYDKLSISRYAHLFPTKQVEMAEKLNNEMEVFQS